MKLFFVLCLTFCQTDLVSLFFVLCGGLALVQLLVLLLGADGRVDEGQLGLSRAAHLGFFLPERSLRLEMSHLSSPTEVN